MQASSWNAKTMQNPKANEHVYVAPRVPQGLAAAVEGLTREVIRHQPDNIYVFAAQHFEKLLRLRQEYDSNNAAASISSDTKKGSKIPQATNFDSKKEFRECATSKETHTVHSGPNGWSLNETAKVLERHRSIFGITGQKISTEEVRELAKETITIPASIQETNWKNNCTRSRIDRHYMCKYGTPKPCRNLDYSQISSHDFLTTCKKHMKNSPKIISQIPLAKDIKTELRRNRLCSRERKCTEEKKIQVACEFREEMFEKVSQKSSDITKKSYESRIEHRRCCSKLEDRSLKKSSNGTGKDKLNSPKFKKSPKGLNDENVKNYVVQNFVGMSSLIDLQPASYVQRVQQVVDETSMVIKEKLEALKAGVVQETTVKKTKIGRSCSTEDRSTTWASDKFSDSERKNSENGKSNIQRSVSAQNLYKKSHSLKSQSSTETSKSPNHESKHSINSEESNDSKISLPAVKSQSSKSSSRSVSAQSNPDGLILPPISPESAKSKKIKENNIVLPVLSTPPSNSITPDDIIDLPDNGEKKSMDMLHVNVLEEFKDSLNVTPELVDAPQRPDSLEASDIEDNDKNSAQGSPIETLKDKLLEIEEVQKRIESVLDESPTIEKNLESKEIETESDNQDKSKIKAKQEKTIGNTSPTSLSVDMEPETLSDNIKRKLQELEDAEKRIGDIFENESNIVSSTKSYSDTISQEKDSGLQGSVESSSDGGNYKESVSDKTNENPETSKSLKKENEVVDIELDRVLSPGSYILTEGSPYDIPSSVTTVIIPDRLSSPESDVTQIVMDNEVLTLSSENENNEDECHESRISSILDAFGEAVNPEVHDSSAIDLDFIEGIKVNPDVLLSPQDLSQIKEEGEKENDEIVIVDSDDEKVLKVVTSSLEEILEKREQETVDNGKAAHSVIEEVETNEEEKSSTTNQIVKILDSSDLSNELKESYLALDTCDLICDPTNPHIDEINDEQKVEKKDEKIQSLPENNEEIEAKLKTSEESDICNFTEEDKDLKETKVDQNFISQREMENTESETKDKLHLEKFPTVAVEEYLEKAEIEEYEILEKIVKSPIPEDEDVNQKSTVTDIKTVKESINEEKFAEDNAMLPRVPVHSCTEIVNIDENVGLVPDNINESVSDESVENEQVNNAELISKEQNSLLTQEHDASTVASTLEFCENVLSNVEDNNFQSFIENDQNNKLQHDSSRSLSQCTATMQLDTNDLSIKTNDDNEKDISQQHPNQSQEMIVTDRAKQIFPDDKSTSGELQQSNSHDSLAKEESERADQAVCEKKPYHIYMSTSNDFSSSTDSATFLTAITKIQSGH